jgi:hypothetical protein
MISSTRDFVCFFLSVEPITVSLRTGFLLVSKSCLYHAKIADFSFHRNFSIEKNSCNRKKKIPSFFRELPQHGQLLRQREPGHRLGQTVSPG